jgi:hypothetical protein
MDEIAARILQERANEWSTILTNFPARWEEVAAWAATAELATAKLAYFKTREEALTEEVKHFWELLDEEAEVSCTRESPCRVLRQRASPSVVVAVRNNTPRHILATGVLSSGVPGETSDAAC